VSHGEESILIIVFECLYKENFVILFTVLLFFFNEDSTCFLFFFSICYLDYYKNFNL